MKSLDDAKARAKVDTQGMLGVLDAYVDDFLQAYDAAANARLAAPASLANVLIAGMGGSGIGGNLVAGLIRGECPVPINIVKDYRVPGFVGPKTLLLAVSYSGGTEETLHVALESKARGATVVGLASGGPLASFAKAKGSYLTIRPGFMPRVALPHLFGTLLGATNALRLATVAPDARLERELRAFHARIRADVPTGRNPAKRLAVELVRGFPIIYGNGSLAPVALRARCQLNENAKMIARNDELPEANHNELVALNALKAGDGFHVTLLREADEPAEIANRFAFVEGVLRRHRVPHETFLADASSPLGRVLQGLLFVDYVSVYAALARGIDPSPMDVISDLKKVLGKTGKAPEIHRRLR